MIKNDVTCIEAYRSASFDRVTFIIVIFCCALLLGVARQALAQEWVYNVRPGDNLWDISQAYLQETSKWVELQQINEIKNPRQLPPGMRLRIPVAWLKVQPAVVRVQHLHGSVYVEHADGRRRQLTLNTTLQVGDKVHTEAEAMTTLRLADGSTVLLQEKSQLSFDTLSIYGKTGMVDSRMRLMDGRMESDVKPIEEPAGRFEIWTPAAVSAVRGTHFRSVMNKDDKLSRTEVSKGHILVSANAQEVVVPQGFGTVVNVGEAPTPPRQLLAAPNLNQLATVVTDPLPHFTLIPLADAVAYRVQIAHAQESNTPFLDRIFSDINLQGPQLGDGDYVLRVRGIDTAGFEGLDADHLFTINIRPSAPMPTLPEPGATRYSSQIDFAWQASDNAASYSFQLATNDTFTDLVTDVTGVMALNMQLERPLMPGVYYWRIASVNDAGKAGAFGTPQVLTVLQTLSTPQIKTVSVDNSLVTVTWDTIDAASAYEVQVAFDPHFKDLWQTIYIENSTAQYPHPRVASYYIRARAIDAVGQPGVYGPAYHVPVQVSSQWLIPIMLLIGFGSL